MRVPVQIRPPAGLDLLLREVAVELDQLSSRLLDPGVQRQIVRRLWAIRCFRDWVRHSRRPLGCEPFCIGPGLPLTPALLVGFARAFFPGLEISPYDIGPAAVTEVCAQAGASALSHSRNDLPAPPHTAGFFEREPPLITVFACVRPHPGGGAETTVADLGRILRALDRRQTEELMRRTLEYRTSRRLGNQVYPFRALRWVRGLPFLRFRSDYVQSQTRLLERVEELLCHDGNQWVAPLAAGEIIFVWNGAPHGRREQIGETPGDPSLRRRLLRCRLRPLIRRVPPPRKTRPRPPGRDWAVDTSWKTASSARS